MNRVVRDSKTINEVVLPDNDPASKIYVRSKIKACQELEIRDVDATPPEEVSTAELFDLICPFNHDPQADVITTAFGSRGNTL